jgi:hypothetical protein
VHVRALGDEQVAQLVGRWTCFVVVAVASSGYRDTIEIVPQHE